MKSRLKNIFKKIRIPSSFYRRLLAKKELISVVSIIAVSFIILRLETNKPLLGQTSEVKSIQTGIKLNSAESQKLNKDLTNIQKAIKDKKASWTADVTDIAVNVMRDPNYFVGLKTPPPNAKNQLNKSQESSKYAISYKTNEVSLPESFDWRNHHGQNYMTSVRNQGSCGSCWAFGAAGAIEGDINAYYNDPNPSLDLSEQDILFCAGPASDGCGGGFPDEAFNYVKANGLVTESCRPYLADKTCKVGADRCPGKNLSQNLFHIETYGSLWPQNTETLKKNIMNYGPVEIAMDVYSEFFFYRAGIYEHISTRLMGVHAVVFVGWGKENGVEYWIAKNSWGTGWGESGYFRYKMSDYTLSYYGYYGFLYVINPTAPQAKTPNCTDRDKDGFCAWGLGPKPANGCPSCSNDVQDCNDADARYNIDCNVMSTPKPTFGPLPPRPSPPLSNADLVVTDINRDTSYYYVDYCNYGTGSSPFKITVYIKDTSTGKGFETNYNYPFDVPTSSQCGRTGGITCGLIGDTNCNNQVAVEATVDWRNTINEINENNNTLTKTFSGFTMEMPKSIKPTSPPACIPLCPGQKANQ